MKVIGNTLSFAEHTNALRPKKVYHVQEQVFQFEMRLRREFGKNYENRDWGANIWKYLLVLVILNKLLKFFNVSYIAQIVLYVG
jgi:hypothetical protein